MMMISIAYLKLLSQIKLLRQQREMYSHFQFRLLYYPAQFSFFIVDWLMLFFLRKCILKKYI